MIRWTWSKVGKRTGSEYNVLQRVAALQTLKFATKFAQMEFGVQTDIEQCVNRARP